MNNKNSKTIIATAISAIATKALISSANNRCMFIYHQPKQPEELKKYRKF